MKLRLVTMMTLAVGVLLGSAVVITVGAGDARAMPTLNVPAASAAAAPAVVRATTRRIPIPAPPIGRAAKTTAPPSPATAPPSTPATSTGVPSPNPCPATARACIDLTRDLSWLQANGKVVYGPVPITSGRPGYLTPPGTFRVFWKHIDHRSSIFGGAPMPYSIFFNGGIAFHQGSVSVLSHGCIHLERAAAQKYWSFLRNGDKVFVFGKAPY